MIPISVDCTFEMDGIVHVRRIAINGRWQAVEQGRQWLDEEGRHVLIMLRGTEVRQIVLNKTTLVWEMKERRRPQSTLV